MNEPKDVASLTPKERFLMDAGRVAAWNAVAEGDGFAAAVDVAALEFARKQTTNVGAVYDAQAVAHRLEGARLFAVELRRLGLRSEPGRIVDTQKLDYESFEQAEGLKPQEEQTQL